MKKWKKKLTAVLMCLATVVLGTVVLGTAPVMADEAEAGNLTIRMSVQEEGNTIPLEGTELSIYKVADIRLEGNTAFYTVTQPYTDLADYDAGGSDYTFDGLTAEQSLELAKKLQKEAENADASAVSDKNGEAVFAGLPYGMYLVVQTGRTGDAASYLDIDPFLISVPFYDGSAWTDNVSAAPKTELIKQTPSHTTPQTPDVTPTPSGQQRVRIVLQKKNGTKRTTASGPITGDSLTPILCAAVLFLAAAALAMLIGRKRNEK